MKLRVLGERRKMNRSTAFFAQAAMALLLLLCGCSGSPPDSPAPSPEAKAPPSDIPVQQPSGPPGAALGLDATFWQTWSDGQAEISSYALRFPRYNAIRNGTAVAIFVTENQSLASRVKTETQPAPGNDAFPVMKLNLVEGFQTGIYDYHVMTSAFIALNPLDGRSAGQPAKVSFSSQEWCGQVYQQLLFGQHGIESTLHSYFEGEGDRVDQLPSPRNAISGDALMLWARGVAQPRMKAGETRSMSYLPTLKSSRFEHQPLGWREVRLSRSADVTSISVPAGTFAVEVFEAAIQGGRTRTYYVERDFPNRIVKWESDDGESAEMLKSIRAKYWQMNDLASEAKLADLGLPYRPLGAP